MDKLKHFIIAAVKILSDGIQRYLPRIFAGWWLCAFLIMSIAIARNIYKMKTQEWNVGKAFFSVLITMYFFGVLIITFGTRLPDPHYAYQLVPFLSYKQAFVDGSENEMFQILCNVLLFIPFGMLFPIWKRDKSESLIQLLKYAFCFSFSIEFMQLITKIGCFEIDDMINNVLGAMIGYLDLCIVRKAKGLCVKFISEKTMER